MDRDYLAEECSKQLEGLESAVSILMRVFEKLERAKNDLGEFLRTEGVRATLTGSVWTKDKDRAWVTHIEKCDAVYRSYELANIEGGPWGEKMKWVEAMICERRHGDNQEPEALLKKLELRGENSDDDQLGYDSAVSENPGEECTEEDDRGETEEEEENTENEEREKRA